MNGQFIPKMDDDNAQEGVDGLWSQEWRQTAWLSRKPDRRIGALPARQSHRSLRRGLVADMPLRSERALRGVSEFMEHRVTLGASRHRQRAIHLRGRSARYRSMARVWLERPGNRSSVGTPTACVSVGVRKPLPCDARPQTTASASATRSSTEGIHSAARALARISSGRFRPRQDGGDGRHRGQTTDSHLQQADTPLVRKGLERSDACQGRLFGDRLSPPGAGPGQ